MSQTLIRLSILAENTLLQRLFLALEFVLDQAKILSEYIRLLFSTEKILLSNKLSKRHSNKND